uniref:Transcription factor CBF/NF-Y/archaeal histone domain-containing protein n=1 Tax=Kalanchoe fedtschenkoi TaxID=63787 RepID=A0A7N0RAT9_KALFE
MRNTRSTPRKGQKPTTKTKKKGHVSNGDVTEAEVASPATLSSPDSIPEPPYSDSVGSDNKSVAEEEDEVEEGAEEQEVEVVKKKTVLKQNGKKRKVEEEEEEEGAKCLFPMNRIRMIAKSEGEDDMRLSHEAIFLLNKASEKFLGHLCEEAYGETVNQRKNFVAYDHLSSVSKNQRLCFLSDLIPEKISVEEALKERQLANCDPRDPTTN